MKREFDIIKLGDDAKIGLFVTIPDDEAEVLPQVEEAAKALANTIRLQHSRAESDRKAKCFGL